MKLYFSIFLIIANLISCQTTDEKKILRKERNIEPVTLDSRPYEEDVYIIVDEYPEFPGGIDKLYEFYIENSEYPIAIKNDKYVEVYFNMVIDEKGEVWKYEIILGRTEALKKNTELLIKKMPNWKPGIKNGNLVKRSINRSIKYAL